MAGTCFIANTEEQILIATDTVGEFYTRQVPSKLMAQYLTANRVFFTEKADLFIASVGPTHIGNFMTEGILSDFISRMNHNFIKEIYEAQELFKKFIKEHYEPYQEEIFLNLNLIFIQVSNNREAVLFNRMQFYLKEGICQELITNTVTIERNSFFVIRANGANSTTYPILTFGTAYERILNHKATLSPVKSPPVSLLVVSRPELPELWKLSVTEKRFYSKHNLAYLDDFLDAYRRGYLGMELMLPYRLIDLEEVFAEVTSKNRAQIQSLEDGKRGQLLSFSQFSKICRNKLGAHPDFTTLYIRVFNFVNSVAKEDALFRHKLQTIFSEGILILIEMSYESNSSILAFFGSYSECITFHPEKLDDYNYLAQTRLFRHQVEYAYKHVIHYKRWPSHPHHSNLEFLLAKKGFANPYFPFYLSERNKWLKLINRVFERTKLLLNLLEKSPSDLTQAEHDFIDKYKIIVKGYQPLLITQPMCLKPNDPLTDPELQRSINNKEKGFFMHIPMHGVSVPIHIHKVRMVDESKSLVLFYGYTIFGQPDLKTPLYDLCFGFNIDFTKESNNAEIHAHLLGAHPTELIAFLSEDLLLYDYYDAREALGEAADAYLSYLTPEKVAAGITIPTPTLLTGLEGPMGILEVTSVAPTPPRTLSVPISVPAPTMSSTPQAPFPVPKVPKEVNASFAVPLGIGRGVPPAIPAPASFNRPLNTGSPVTASGDAHQQLLNRITPIIEANKPRFDTFFESITAKKYGQAVRRACTSKDEKAYELLQFLLHFKSTLTIPLDEKVGDKEQSALHIAAERGNQRAYDLLRSAGAEDKVDKSGKFAAEYLNEHLSHAKNAAPALQSS